MNQIQMTNGACRGLERGNLESEEKQKQESALVQDLPKSDWASPRTTPQMALPVHDLRLNNVWYRDKRPIFLQDANLEGRSSWRESISVHPTV